METTSKEIRQDFNKRNGNNIVLKVLYFIMFRLMDLESILWWIAEKAIYPTALLRRKVANIIHNKIKA